MPKILQLVLLLLGVVIIFCSLFVLWQRDNSSRLQFDPSEVERETTDSWDRTVAGLVIEDIGVRLPVVPAQKEGSTWETTSNGVSYLVSSPLPGDQGNSILYGHNWGSILGNLHTLVPGSKIEVYYSDGTKNEFEVAEVNEVSPEDSRLLSRTQEHILTIYTCSGIFDQKRIVVTSFLL